MAEEGQWVTFDDSEDEDEALSLCDLPVAPAAEGISRTTGDQNQEHRSPAKDEFAFRILRSGAGNNSPETEMCAAEDIFFDGQLRPLRPNQIVSRSDSSGSLGFLRCRSVSMSSSSTRSPSRRVSRSPSSNSNFSAFYTYPSPNPQLHHGRKSVGSRGGSRIRTGSAPPVGWGLIRLGVAMAPEMEVKHIRFRQGGGGQTGEARRRLDGVSGFIGGRLGCKCSPEDAVSTKIPITTARKKEESRGVRGVERKERIAEWLEELFKGKGAMD
ncbi:hypothetical protein AXF42_Ash009151 [Apostasia shenzhenica]|uniref:Uncharacterized protein n=1 Tax=Apostasia shenzhenica TaxID=1088818 RepID=A0A2I0ADS2_9ASPA|nr:hypothetical protein AXF42_Ash009151 [Apostasia shenzhenica]